MNQLSVRSVRTGGNANPYRAKKAGERPQKRGVSWKEWAGLALVAMLVAASLSPLVLTWAGSWWMDEQKLAAVQHPARGVYVRLDEMPDYVWKAFVAIEDHRYMQHSGVDPYGLARAIWIDVQKGAYVQGGSTITMQLARNLFLTDDKTMGRKIKEIAIALQLETRYSKKELLELYLNAIYFGHGHYGIGEAARFYFGKPIAAKGEGASLTMGEAAILAALPKAPETYSPVRNWEKAKARQLVVLDRMAELHVIDQETLKQAKREQVVVKAGDQPRSAWKP
ncbi:transglycosylase domain-containing protein [Brevibacillus sp. SAFN-007a]|uniref:transglycosylase domain-containing protein n=1 Tax=Brevibacillus sp. SAFN-007a TaxID=3436862 RepID=UPI003F808997